MRIDLEFVELHSSLFLADINFGTKLYSDPKRMKAPIEMYYDTDLEHTVVIYKNKVAIIESTASKTLKEPSQIGLRMEDQVKTTTNYIDKHAVTYTPVSAQVSTPQDKVQGKPGRRPKYQGEEAP